MARILDDWLSAYLEYTENTEAPTQFHLWTGISTIASVLRRRVYFDMGHFKWYPNHMIFFIAPPGVATKSITSNLGKSLLSDIDYIKFGADMPTWQYLLTQFVDSREDIAFPDGSFEPMSAITVHISELGNFLRPGDIEIINVLIDLYDCHSFDKGTIGTGVYSILNPYLNFIGCATPAWVAENFNGYFTEGGLASRSIFIYAKLKQKLVVYPYKKKPNPRLREYLLRDLFEISNLFGAYTLTDAAEDLGEAWYISHNTVPNETIKSARFSGYLSRKQSHVHKLAMVRAASRHDVLSIQAEDLQWALDTVTAIEPDLESVFGEAVLNPHMKLQREIMTKLRIANGSMPKAHLYAAFVASININEFEAILNSLISAEKVILVAGNGGVLVELVDQTDG